MAGMKDSKMFQEVLEKKRQKKAHKGSGIPLQKRNHVKIQAEEEARKGRAIDQGIRQPVDLREFVTPRNDDDWDLVKSRQRSAQYAKKAVVEKGEVDPLGTGATLMPELLKIVGPRMLVVKSKKKLNAIKVMDTETWSLNPSQLHFGYVWDPANKKKVLFRDWQAPVKEHREFYKRDSKASGVKKGDVKSVSYYTDYTQPGFIDYVNFDIISHDKDEGYFQRIYAHNMMGFEGVGLASKISSNRDYDPAYEQSSSVLDENGSDRFTWLQKANRHPDVEPYLRKGLWEDNGKNCTPLLIKTPVIDPDTGHILRYEDVSWTIKSAGDKHYIQVKYGKNITEIVDSMWHLPGKLENYGAKGETPLKYTNPTKWLKEEMRSGRLNIPSDISSEEVDQMLYEHWFNDLTDEDKEYCLQDCKILAEALNRYRDIYGEYFKDPVTGIPVDPLESLTLAAAALTGMIISSPRSLRDGLLNDRGFAKAMIGWDAGMLGGKPSFHLLNTPEKQAWFYAELGHLCEKQSSGYVNKDFPTLIDRPLFMDPGIAAMFKWVQHGGRTEVYQPQNAPGTRVVVLDINNSYGTSMYGLHNGETLRVAEPTEIKQLSDNIHGREALLEHLDNYSGMYLIRSKPPKLQSLRNKYPIFGLRMAGTEYDERLCFPDWEGRIYLYVTGEELRYMLQMSDIEDDDIVALKVGSYAGPLIDMTKMPFASFVQMVYADRRRDNVEIDNLMREIESLEAEGKDASTLRVRAAQLAADRQIRKNLLNTSYGKMVENHKNTEVMTAIRGLSHRNKAILEKMRAMTTEWQDWYRMDQIEDFGSEEALILAMDWGNDHYMPVYKRNIASKNIMRIKISLPGELAQYAIRSLGTAITAYGRIFLHKGLMAVDRVLLDESDTATDFRDFAVCYVDTDSMHIQVPEDMTDEQVIQKLAEPTVLIDGKEKPIIKIGDGLGEWKLEKVKVTPWLLDEKTEEKLEREGLGTHNVDAFYLAPKHYYITTKPDAEGYRHILQEVIKGVSSGHTAMRVAMYGFSVSSSKLGDPYGMQIEKPVKMDLMRNLKDVKAHRRSYDEADKLSKPVVIRAPMTTDLIAQGGIKNPDGGVSGVNLSYIDYMSAVQTKTFGYTSGVGLNRALDRFVRGCKARGLVVRDLRMKIRKAHELLSTRIQSDRDSSKMLHYNYVMEWVENSFISQPFEIKENGAISVVDQVEQRMRAQKASEKPNTDSSPSADSGQEKTDDGLDKPQGSVSVGPLDGVDLWDDMFDENEED